MRKPTRSSLLEETISILIRHFGVEKVRAVLDRVSARSTEATQKPLRNAVPREHREPTLTAVDALEAIRETEPEKYRLLSEFLERLKARESLPESQDIRQFAQLVGLKHVEGRSRKDMLPVLLRFLLTMTTDQLRIDVQRADSISERERQQGFSVLTDKLLGEK